MTTVFPLSPSNGATYIPPQIQKLLAGDIGSNYKFGSDVGISSDGTIAVIGSSGNGSSATGAAYVFTKNGSTFSQKQKLTDSSGVSNDFFGDAVAISGDGLTIAVGAWQEDSGATTNNGAVYIFNYNAGMWSQQAKLFASVTSSNASFGFSVALSSDGNTLIVGAKDVDATVGAAYVFTRSGVTWTQQQKITPNATTASFGYSVAISSNGGNTALIGDNGGGRTEVWTRSGVTWTYQANLTQFTYTGQGTFGNDVSLSSDGNIAVVGDSGIDANNTNYGVAYVYTRSGSTWSNAQALIPTDLGYQSVFGLSVEISSDGSTIAVGQRISANSYGEVHIYKKPSTTWVRTYILSSPDSVNADVYGDCLALSTDGSVIFTGAYLEDSIAGALTGNGAVYTYNFNNIGTRYTYNSTDNRWEISTSIPKKAPTTHLFTSSVSSWTIPTSAKAIHAVVIAGGGSGGVGGVGTSYAGGGGGGGGGMSIHTYNLISGYQTTAVITVGAGATSGTGGTSSFNIADSGSLGALTAAGGTAGGTGGVTSSNPGAGGLGMFNGGAGGLGVDTGKSDSPTTGTGTRGGGSGGGNDTSNRAGGLGSVSPLIWTASSVSPGPGGDGGTGSTSSTGGSGTVGQLYGGGGGGGGASASGFSGGAGGAGAQGCVFLTVWYE